MKPPAESTRRIASPSSFLAAKRGLLLALVLSLAGSSAPAAVFLVNSVGDGGDATPGDGLCSTGTIIVVGVNPLTFAEACTLRAAIEEANANAGADTVTFGSNLPAPGGFVEFLPGAALPLVTDPLTIDGYSHPAYAQSDPDATPIINLRGTNAGVDVPGLIFVGGASNSVIRGLAISGFSGSGIAVIPFLGVPAPGGLVIEGNHLGFARGGDFSAGNGEDGLLLDSSDFNTIGFRCTADEGCVGRRNVISGNGRHGIQLTGTSTENVIGGNLIGTNAEGSGFIGLAAGLTSNHLWGVLVDSFATNNEIGTYVPANSTDPTRAAGNTISANRSGGVHVRGDLNRVFANRIGSDSDGSFAFGLQRTGVQIAGDAVRVGGRDFGRNLISGNDEAGVVITGERAIIQDNLIGPGAAGLDPIGNGMDGVVIDGFDALVRRNVIGANARFGIVEIRGGTLTENFVGTDAQGTPLGNGEGGILLSGREDATVGGPGGLGNTIGFNPIGVWGSLSSEGASVVGNFIGTNEAGAYLSNSQQGILMEGSDYSIGDVFGLFEPVGNVIGWNGGAGIEARGRNGSLVANHVGTTPDGQPIGNFGPGILVDPVVGDFMNVGGGATLSGPFVPAVGNHIAFNAGAGIVLEDGPEIPFPGTEAVSIRGNVLHSNGGLAIDLGHDGVTPNDPADPDEGDNRLQNWPVLDPAFTSWDLVTGDLQVRYRIDTDPTAATFPLTVDFYIHDPWLEPGDQARVWVGSDVYTAAEASTAKDVTFTPAPGTLIPNPLGFVFEGLRATATDADGNTSELSIESIPVPEPGVAGGLLAGAIALAGLRRKTQPIASIARSR